MSQPTQPISPLRQRMIEDMHIRKLSPQTQASYICAVKKLSDYLDHSPHTATAEDLRKFQLHLTDIGTFRIRTALGGGLIGGVKNFTVRRRHHHSQPSV